MNAWYLNLSYCPNVTEVGIENISWHCPSLANLNVTGCEKITRRFILSLATRMRFSEPAHTYFGLQQKANVLEIRAGIAEESKKLNAAIAIQKRMRGKVSRTRTRLLKREKMINETTSHCQAIVRGYLTRKWLKQWKYDVQRHRSAAIISATWKGYIARKRARILLDEQRFWQAGHGNARHIQRGWRGHCGRKRAQQCRDKRAQEQLKLAKHQVRQELSAVNIQRIFRGLQCQKRLAKHLREKEEAEQIAAARGLAAIKICGILMMKKAQKELKRLQEERDQMILEWEMALRIQRVWRVRQAKLAITVLTLLREEKRRHEAVLVLQAFWRACRARQLSALQKALSRIRRMQGTAAISIQKVFRGFKGRKKAKKKRAELNLARLMESSALAIQRVLRGHKGRERWECCYHLQEMDSKIRPLKQQLAEYEQKREKIRAELDVRRTTQVPLKEVLKEVKEEMFHVSNTKDRYTDSNKVTGVMQRFMTKFLLVRLQEINKATLKRLKKLDKECLDREVNLRQLDRLIREVQRELLPMGKGLTDKVILQRTSRLRTMVRTQKRAATSIQKVFRGWRVRTAIASEVRQYWIEVEDEATGDIYYFNTWSEEAVWHRPLAYVLFGQPEEGNFELENDQEPVYDEWVGMGVPAPEQDTEEPVHTDWLHIQDPQLVMAYWYNPITFEYRWSDPDCEATGGFATPVVPPEDMPEGFIPMESDGETWLMCQQPAQLSQRSEELQKIGHTWCEMIDTSSNVRYYHSKEDGEVRWSLSPRSAFGNTPQQALVLAEEITQEWQEERVGYQDGG
ncbi:unnamed protein product [Chrysoparadoxa australica]